MSIELSTRQANALRALLECRDFSVDDVAKLDYQVLIRTPGVGKKSVRQIREWLLQFSKDLSNCPSALPKSMRQVRLERRLEDAEKLLLENGYQVEAPGEVNSS